MTAANSADAEGLARRVVRTGSPVRLRCGDRLAHRLAHVELLSPRVNSVRNNGPELLDPRAEGGLTTTTLLIGVYRPRFVRHRIACYAARAAGESWFCRTAAGVWNPCRSMSQVVL